MKHLLISLFIGCLMSPAWSQGHEMTLEEFAQKLERAKPWTREKVEAELGVNSIETSSTDAYITHTASGQFVYGKEFIATKISLDISKATENPVHLKIMLDEKSTCMPSERIEELFPIGVPYDFSNDRLRGLLPGFYPKKYSKKYSWGYLTFYFGENKDCLTGIKISISGFFFEKAEPYETALKEFVQKLEEARPWTRKKIESMLSVEFTIGYSQRTASPPSPFKVYGVSRKHEYSKGLMTDEVIYESLETKYTTGTPSEVVSFRIVFSDKSYCFLPELISKLYPGGHLWSWDYPQKFYAIERPWWKLIFNFNGWDGSYCMSSISIEPNALLEKEK